MSTKRVKRTARLEAKVEPRIQEAVERFAMDKGYSVSSAINRILMDWERLERRRARRREGAD